MIVGSSGHGKALSHEDWGLVAYCLRLTENTTVSAASDGDMGAGGPGTLGASDKEPKMEIFLQVKIFL